MDVVYHRVWVLLNHDKFAMDTSAFRIRCDTLSLTSKERAAFLAWYLGNP